MHSLRECYRRLLTRRKVAFNFIPRKSTQAVNAMKTELEQGAMNCGFTLVKKFFDFFTE